MEESLASILYYLQIISRLSEFSMRRTILIIILKAIFVFCFIGAEEPKLSGKQTFPIEISVFDGQGSLLIEWTFPDSIIANQIRLFVQESGESEFKLLAELPPAQTQYLDLNCDPETRYFYKIEIDDVFGKTFFSDLIIPVFGICFPVDNSLAFNSNIVTLYDLALYEIQSQCTFYDSEIDFISILELLKIPEVSNFVWLGNLPFDRFGNLDIQIQILDNIIQNKTLMVNLLSYEMAFRNHLFISPDSWESEVEKTINSLINRWDLLYAEFPNSLERLETIAPIRLTKFHINEENKKEIEMFVFYPEQLRSSDIFLLSGEEYLNLGEFLNGNNSTIKIQIPMHWEKVGLMMDNIFIQSSSTIFDESVSFTLDGDIIPVDTSRVFTIGRYPSSLWINELAWDPYTRRLHLEVTGETQFDNQFSFMIKEETIWDIEPFSSFDSQFQDSSVTISEDYELPLLLIFQQTNNSDLTTIEYLLLDSLPLAINRIPDGGPWHYTELTSLGLTNEPNQDYFETDLLPELFVLYQNYPNPFNGQTRISFDLLEDATMSMYITDATGRIHDKFMEREFMTSGSYHYNWNGEGRSTGIYFFTIHAQVDNRPPAIFSRKMIYLK